METKVGMKLHLLPLLTVGAIAASIKNDRGSKRIITDTALLSPLAIGLANSVQTRCEADIVVIVSRNLLADSRTSIN